MEPPRTYCIPILNDSGRRIRTERLDRAAALALADLGLSSGELSLRLTTDAAVKRLNFSFRGVASSTDVLTFPAGDYPSGAMKPLGDIAISVDQAERQSQARGISLEEEISYLAIHGILHLAGLDDESDEEREAMTAEMARLGRLAGLPAVKDWHTMAGALS